jgi:hypothetical protein
MKPMWRALNRIVRREESRKEWEQATGAKVVEQTHNQNDPSNIENLNASNDDGEIVPGGDL